MGACPYGSEMGNAAGLARSPLLAEDEIYIGVVPEETRLIDVERNRDDPFWTASFLQQLVISFLGSSVVVFLLGIWLNKDTEKKIEGLSKSLEGLSQKFDEMMVSGAGDKAKGSKK